jgi:hypothetical protein
MQLTFIGMFIILFSIPIMLVGGLEAMFILMLMCGPMNGSAALFLSTSSITPVHFVLGLTTLRLLISPPAFQRGNVPALLHNWPLVAFAFYGAVMALLGPRIFYHAADLPSLRGIQLRGLYDTVQLAPSMQNLTTSIYLIGTMAAAVIAHVLFSRPGNARLLVKWAIVIGWINLTIGVLSVLAGPSDAPTFLRPLFELFRNGAYAQLNHEFKGYVRVTGLFPEASAYAAYTFTWFCFIFECWLRNVQPGKTGPLALAMFVLLLISTSSSAYIGLAAFSLVLIVRLILSPALISSSKMGVLAAAGLAGLIGSVGAMVLVPHFAEGFGGMLEHMTIGKSTSTSGLQRAFWARKSIEAFQVSGGLGVGPGSLRSSGLFTAILGSSGVIGLALFLTYLYRVLRPLASSTYTPVEDEDASVGVAAAWAAILCIVPLGIAASSPDPGLDFGLLAGAALALRTRAGSTSRNIPVHLAYRPVLSRPRRTIAALSGTPQT